MVSEREQQLMSLVALSVPLEEARRIAATWGSSSDDMPVLTRSNIESVIRRYLSRELSSLDVEAWADLVEMRDDVDYEEENREWIIDALNVLSNPSINGPLTPDLAKEILAARSGFF